MPWLLARHSTAPTREYVLRSNSACSMLMSDDLQLPRRGIEPRPSGFRDIGSTARPSPLPVAYMIHLNRSRIFKILTQPDPRKIHQIREPTGEAPSDKYSPTASVAERLNHARSSSWIIQSADPRLFSRDYLTRKWASLNLRTHSWPPMNKSKYQHSMGFGEMGSATGGDVFCDNGKLERQDVVSDLHI